MSVPIATSNASASGRLALLGMAAVAVLSLAPLLLETRPVDFVPPSQSLLNGAGKLLIVAMVALAVAGCSLLEGRRAGWRNLGLFLLAGLMTLWHWAAVDARQKEMFRTTTVNGVRHHERLRVPVEPWQRRLYLDILSCRPDTPPERFRIPHVYRSLPYGFVRSLERLTGDWRFSFLAYRWLFTFWFLWAAFHFVALFLNPARAWVSVGVIVLLYPLSVMYYLGQLTDPMSHAFFVLALLWIVQDRWLLVLSAVALGVMAKETALILVPAYLACHWRLLAHKSLPVLLRTVAIGLAAVAAYVAVRLPVGWVPGLESPGGTIGWMVSTNLGIGRALYRGPAPLYQNYLQPLLFVGVFVPMILPRWRQADGRLRALFLTVTPLLLLSSLCFSWLHESRNYVPLLPLLLALALAPRRAPQLSPAGGTNP